MNQGNTQQRLAADFVRTAQLFDLWMKVKVGFLRVVSYGAFAEHFLNGFMYWDQVSVRCVQRAFELFQVCRSLQPAYRFEAARFVGSEGQSRSCGALIPARGRRLNGPGLLHAPP